MSAIDLLSFSDGLADAAAAAAPSVLQVHGRRRPASGVVFAPDLVITTARALGREDGVRLRTPDGRALTAELAGWDPATGLILLRADGLDIPAAAPSELTPRVGHLALAIARSWSNSLTATTGTISVIGGPLPTGPGRAIDRVLRTTAPMHGGFAGGAFVDVRGRLIGITTAAAIRGLGVVIPVDIAWAVAARLADHGSVPRGYLGLSGQPVRLSERQQPSGDSPAHALLVVAVVPGSPADQGGILVGDLVTTFDGVPVQSPVDLLELLAGDRVGRAISIGLLRGGTPQELQVTVGTRSERP
jgi:S1-C subfamily serine protease